MNTLTTLILTYGIVATATFAQEPSGPFGLRKGMPQEQVIELVGRGAVKETKNDTIRLLTVPKPHTKFDLYSLIFSPKDGLLKIVAYGKDIRTNSFGESLHDAFIEIRGRHRTRLR